jgi:hypothetical protein
MGRGGSKEPPGGIISPMALYARAQLMWNTGNFYGEYRCAHRDFCGYLDGPWCLKTRRKAL